MRHPTDKPMVGVPTLIVTVMVAAFISFASGRIMGTAEGETRAKIEAVDAIKERMQFDRSYCIAVLPSNVDSTKDHTCLSEQSLDTLDRITDQYLKGVK